VGRRHLPAASRPFCGDSSAAGCCVDRSPLLAEAIENGVVGSYAGTRSSAMFDSCSGCAARYREGVDRMLLPAEHLTGRCAGVPVPLGDRSTRPSDSCPDFGSQPFPKAIRALE
jgi:hypothetical protein